MGGKLSHHHPKWIVHNCYTQINPHIYIYYTYIIHIFLYTYTYIHAYSHCGNAVGQPLLPEEDDEGGSREALEHWSNQVPISVLRLGADWNMNSGVDSG